MSISPPVQSLPSAVREGRRFWESTPGVALWRAERACLGPHCEQHRGIVSLQMGMAPMMSDMCPIRHALDWVPSPDLVRNENSLICLPDSLPLADDSVDLTLLHHLLEAVDQPHHVLQEAARVTRSDGRLLVFGWHPFGPAAARRGKRPTPWRKQWRTPGRLRDWLTFVDFEIERVDYCGFRLPGRASGSDRLETLGRRYNVPLATAYLLVARRRNVPVQPIKLRKPVLQGRRSGAWLGLAKEAGPDRPRNRDESNLTPASAKCRTTVEPGAQPPSGGRKDRSSESRRERSELHASTREGSPRTIA
ncbi:class I SAM-dependent methyltransferase [Salinicola corii]|uniref:Class I SAM-dependent methyltransferase n=1 Tax=Salinicola corii TaxID=2606937 RepID=A0A640WG62_9GAMM|nr:class I SAM-dependent methyltransferase [Salinicola corii]KAA0019210.1 class I SAM-dependent methyltransferase [Salinicola corii]